MRKRLLLMLLTAFICIPLPAGQTKAADLTDDAVYADGTVSVTAVGLDGYAQYLVRVVDVAEEAIIAMSQAKSDGNGLLSVSIVAGFLAKPQHHKVYINDMDGRLAKSIIVRKEEGAGTEEPPASGEDGERPATGAGTSFVPQDAASRITKREDNNTVMIIYSAAPEPIQTADEKRFVIRQDIISQMVSMAQETGGDAKPALLEFEMNLEEGEPFAIRIPAAGWEEIAADANASVKINAGYAVIVFDVKAIETINKRKQGDVIICVAPGVTFNLDDAAMQKIDGRPSYDISVRSGDAAITDLEGGKAVVSLKYTPMPEENLNAIVVYRVAGGGDLEIVNGRYIRETGRAEFVTDRLSLFAVGYHFVAFKDVPSNTWYSDAVEFLAARDIVQGTGDGMFSPELKIKRADFLIMSMNAFGMEPDEEIVDNFTDAGNKYYARYLGTAKRLGLVNGAGNGKFAPEEAISRQDMFVILYRILDHLNELPVNQGIKDADDFADADKIAAYALEAVQLFAGAGIIQGDGVRLDPQAASTRAQSARILYNLLMLQSLTKNG